MDDVFSPFGSARSPRTTKSAEGLPRRFFTTEEVKALARAGFFDPDERFELIGGEIVPMNAKHNKHEIWKKRLAMQWSAKLLGGQFDLAVETTVYLSDGFMFDPDIVIYDRSIQPEDVRGPDYRIIVEISDTSFNRDMTRKAPEYARHGVLEYWVLNALTRRAHLFAEPKQDGNWGQTSEHGEDESLVPAGMPDLAIKLTDLDF